MKHYLLSCLASVVTDRTTLLNVGTLAAVNLTSIDMILKIILTLATLVWTIFKIASEIEKRRKNDESPSK